MSAADFSASAHVLLAERAYVADFLPRRVKSASWGRLHRAETHWLNAYDELGLRARMTNILLKLMCYRRVETDWGGYKENPSPTEISAAVRELMENHSGTLSLLLPEDKALLVLEWDCLSIYVYNPGAKLRRLMKKIARSEGFSWRVRQRNKNTRKRTAVYYAVRFRFRFIGTAGSKMAINGRARRKSA